MIRSLCTITLLCLGHIAWSQPSAPPQSFRNAALHFSFSYPAAYINRVTPASLAAARDAAKTSGGPGKVADCTEIPVAAIHPIDGLFDMVMLLQLDLGCAGQPLNDASLVNFTKGVAEKLLSNHGTAKLGSPRSFDLAGHQAVYLPETVDESAKAAGRILYGVSVCTLIDKSAVCWALLSYNPKTLDTLIELPVTFDDRPVQALVPSDFLPTPDQSAESAARPSH